MGKPRRKSRKPRPKHRAAPRSNPQGVLRITGAGYGFVSAAEGEYFVAASKRGGAADGDRVEIAPLSPRRREQPGAQAGAGPEKRPTARVVRVISRAHATVVGRYGIAEPFGVVVPADARIPYDIFTMHADNPGVGEGDAVRVRMVTYPSRSSAATGIVEEVVGRAGQDSLPIDIIVASHGLETRFSEASLGQARAAAVDEGGALGAGYRDLRDRFVFTIDPADARDFDDALSLDEVDGVLRLGVHIADVSHYVAWGSPLDLEARRRATSVYLVDRAIPMLPEALSSDICSLRPHEARRALSVDMYLTAEGEVIRSEFFPSLICSAARLTYGEAQGFLDAGASRPLPGQPPLPGGGGQRTRSGGDGQLFGGALAKRLSALGSLAQACARRRAQAGSIDFETTEAKVRLDGRGRPVGVDLRRRTEATALVEEAMILANRTVASYLSERGVPCIYRVHEPPSPESLAGLAAVFEEFGYFKTVPVSDFIAGAPKALQAVLAQAEGTPASELVSSLLLRAMKRADYRDLLAPHFGLALPAYTHFTSPIRRYPDLVVHRMLKSQLGCRGGGALASEVSGLAQIARHASSMERTAEAAARQSQEYKLVEYLQRDIGKTFEAVVSGVAASGIFVRLPNTAEGMVPLRCLGDERIDLDVRRHMLTGQKSRRAFRPGTRVRVVLHAADPPSRRLDFRLA